MHTTIATALLDHIKVRRVFSLFLNEKIYQTLKTVFNHVSSTVNFIKNIPLRVVFSSLFSAFGNVIKHVLTCLKYC